MKFFILFFAFCCMMLWGQSIDLVRAGATARPGGAANVQEVRDIGGGMRGLELSCVFTASPDCKRASWDIPLNLDLSQTAGLKLILCCNNMEIVNQFSVYVRAGNVWHAAEYEVSSNGVWHEVYIPKTRFRMEGAGSSTWSRCNTLRLVMWKGASGISRMFIARAEFLRPNASIAILRPYGNPKQGRIPLVSARNLNDALASHGIMPAVIDGDDLAYSTLRLYKMLLVPCPEALDSGQTATLVSCMRSGCKAGLFHALSPRIAAQFGTPLGKYVKLSGTGSSADCVVPTAAIPGGRSFRHSTSSIISVDVVPQGTKVLAYWGSSSGRSIGKPAVLENKSGFWMTHTCLNQDPIGAGRFWLRVLSRFVSGVDKTGAAAVLSSTGTFCRNSVRKSSGTVSRRYDEARNAFFQGRYADCIELCNDISQNAAGDSSAKTANRAGELRGIWCQNPNGLPGRGWKGTVPLLVSGNINVVFPMAAAAYFTAYPSRIVTDNRGNGLAECVAASHGRGIAVHAWMNCLDVEDAPPEVLTQWNQEGRLQKDSAGKTLRWLCPVNASNRRLLARLAADIVARNSVDGLHFDRIRYPGSDSCFCSSCRSAFEKYAGTICRRWPDDVKSGELRSKWLEFRVACINTVLAEMLNAARTAKSRIMFSAAVYPDMNQSRQNVGQDWGQWLRGKWLSFASPMNYVGNTGQFTATLKRQIKGAGGGERIVPGIGLSPCHLSKAELNRQIDAVRLSGLPGYVIFDLRHP